MHILITRPVENAIPLATKLKNLGHQVLIDPLLKIIPLKVQLPPLQTYQAIVATSQHALYSFSHLTTERDIPLWCVGSESAKAAKSLGFKNIHEASGTAQNLVERLIETIKPFDEKSILHISGDVIRVDIVSILLKNNISAERIILYKSEASSSFSNETRHAIENKFLDAVLFFSPRTARIFYNLCHSLKIDHFCSSLIAVCLSKEIKTEIQGLPWKKIQTAKKTSTDDLLLTLMMAD
ncbi:MAG: uroporphyrinogen-III synthase [Alphaproteobacteria bacterium]|nr:uroporphyrinogen-III synthase [Alphaproteobacteria bacterium]